VQFPQCAAEIQKNAQEEFHFSRKNIIWTAAVLKFLLGGAGGLPKALIAIGKKATAEEAQERYSSVFTPEARAQLLGIVIGSTVKGLIAGVLIGYFAKKVNSLPLGILFGLGVGLLLAFAVAAMPNPEGKHYYFEIMLPGGNCGNDRGLRHPAVWARCATRRPVKEANPALRHWCIGRERGRVAVARILGPWPMIRRKRQRHAPACGS
jgi:MFS family permease